MVALRARAIGAFSTGPFWFSALCAALMPTSLGYQDLAALFTRRPGVSELWREHLIASPFGTIEAATFSFSRPIGTAMPDPPASQPVSFDPGALDVKVWSANAPPTARPAVEIEYPTVNRRRKGDRLSLPQTSPGPNGPESLPQPQPIDAPATLPARPSAPPAPITVPRLKETELRDATPPAAAAALDEHGDARDTDAEDAAAMADRPPDIPAADASDQLEAGTVSFLDEDPTERDAQLYFGVAAMGSRDGLQPWAPGAAPVMVSPSLDPDIKLAALEGRTDAGSGGETVAGKDDASRLESPAVRLGLTGKRRAKAEKCLADAVYFEARGEPLRGQMAVAQVVMNRVFSGYYPNNVCGVVYQNANHYLACQFTFACDGIPDVVNEPDMWARAKRIAKNMLDGKIWLAEVGHATHYHAYWVHPSWVHEMKKMYKLGAHTFYRPRAWGDGSDAPVWGKLPVTPKPEGAAAEKPAAAKGAQAVLSPPTGKNERTAKL